MIMGVMPTVVNSEQRRLPKWYMSQPSLFCSQLSGEPAP